MSVQTVLFPKPTPPRPPKPKIALPVGRGRKYFGFPCDVAQELPQENRVEHIRDCKECQRLEIELDTKVGVTEHIYS